jgi:hypothetical protein
VSETAATRAASSPHCGEPLVIAQFLTKLAPGFDALR